MTTEAALEIQFRRFRQVASAPAPEPTFHIWPTPFRQRGGLRTTVLVAQIDAQASSLERET